MGANKSIHVRRSKLDLGVDFTRKLCSSNMLSLRRLSSTLVSVANGSFRLKHPGLFYYSDLLDMSWHKGLHDSDLSLTYNLDPPSLTIKHSVSPEVGIYGIPVNNFSHSLNQGVRLSKLSIGYDYLRPSESDSRTGEATGVYFKRFHFTHDGGRSISTDRDGFPLTRSGGPSDNVIVISQRSRYEDESDDGFTIFSVKIELGTPIPPTLLTYSRLQLSAARGIKLGPALFFSRVSGRTVMGSCAPYQAFAIGGPNSVRGYGEGAIGVGQSCLVSTSELSIPLVLLWSAVAYQLEHRLPSFLLPMARCHQSCSGDYVFRNKKLTGIIFLDCGSDLWSSNKVANNPAERHGKPGIGFGIGGGIRFKTPLAQLQVDYVINAFQKGTAYFGISDLFL